MKWGDTTMKIFISWSGDTSLEIAKILKEWIPCVIHNVEPYFSASDIDKGTRWSTDIAKELENADFGILCVTKDNLNSSWLNFEAGSLSKAIDKARVCPFLYDLKPSDITNSPILQFQMTNFDREDMYKLFQSINHCLEEHGLEDPRLEKCFNLAWDKMNAELRKIAPKTEDQSKKKVNQGDMLEEMLELLRSQQILLRNPEKMLPREYLYSSINKPIYNRRNSNRLKMLLDSWLFLKEQIINTPFFKDDNNIHEFIEITELLFSYFDITAYRPSNFTSETAINSDK